jgi:hypothetical protein
MIFQRRCKNSQGRCKTISGEVRTFSHLPSKSGLGKKGSETKEIFFHLDNFCFSACKNLSWKPEMLEVAGGNVLLSKGAYFFRKRAQTKIKGQLLELLQVDLY